MESFDWVTIQEISREDLMLIIYSLNYTYKQTNIEDFKDLKDNLVTELSTLAGISESEFIKLLKK